MATVLREYPEHIVDPTHGNLSAALLDQVVAGAMRGKDYAFVPVAANVGWSVGIAVANEDGYTPLANHDAFKFTYRKDADKFCSGMNKHIGLPPDHATDIIVSTMGGRTYRR